MRQLCAYIPYTTLPLSNELCCNKSMIEHNPIFCNRVQFVAIVVPDQFSNSINTYLLLWVKAKTAGGIFMPFERWGSLSVDDHIDTEALIANVLLFDRLIIPVMTEQPDRNERAYWVSKGWDPTLQSERLNLLDDLVVRRPWNEQRRSIFRTRLDELKAEQSDVDGKQLTRMILAQEEPIEKTPDIDGVTVVPTYSSRQAFEQDFFMDTEEHLGAQACLLSRQLAVPVMSTPCILKETIKLSRDKNFRVKRAELFDWQEIAISRHWSPQEAVARVSDMTERHNAIVKDALGDVRWKLSFTIFGIGLGFAAGEPFVAGLAAALLLVQFVKFDRKPVIQPGITQPAAMFYDVQQQLGINFTRDLKK